MLKYIRSYSWFLIDLYLFIVTWFRRNWMISLKGIFVYFLDFFPKADLRSMRSVFSIPLIFTLSEAFKAILSDFLSMISQDESPQIVCNQIVASFSSWDKSTPLKMLHSNLFLKKMKFFFYSLWCIASWNQSRKITVTVFPFEILTNGCWPFCPQGRSAGTD